MPCSSDDVTIDHIYGVISWKELADSGTTAELVLEVDQALREIRRAARACPAHAPRRARSARCGPRRACDRDDGPVRGRGVRHAAGAARGGRTAFDSLHPARRSAYRGNCRAHALRPVGGDRKCRAARSIRHRCDPRPPRLEKPVRRAHIPPHAASRAAHGAGGPDGGEGGAASNLARRSPGADGARAASEDDAGPGGQALDAAVAFSAATAPCPPAGPSSIALRSSSATARGG